VPTKKEKQPLSVTHPELASQLISGDASQISRWSKEKFDWKCINGHIWKASIESRTHLKSGCPYCAGIRVLTGFNDLQTKYPEIANQAFGWDPTITPTKSKKNFAWKCRFGHIWEASISNRTRGGNGCTVCSGRSLLVGFNDFQTTNPELAKQLVGTDPRSFVGGHAKLKWNCEFGHTWMAQVNNRVSHGQGCPVCTNKKVLVGFNDFLTTDPELAQEIVDGDPRTFTRGTTKKYIWVCKMGHRYSTTPLHRISGNGCHFCSGKYVLVGFNDFLTTNPEVAKNLVNADPATFTKGSNKFFEWKCELGHIWKAQTGTIIRSSGFGCPFCSGNKVLVGFNDLSTTHPLVAKNALGWDPTKYSAGSNVKKMWACSEKHKWNAVITSVVQSNQFGCPTCSTGGFDPNADGYLYFLTHSNWEMFQIGITNVPDDRLSRHQRLGWEVLELRGPMDGHLTQQWETAILRMLKSKGADLSNSKIAGKFDGYSEAWSKSTFEVKSIKELMRLTEEFEQE
jgi:hypothetical protein